jgi:hypothetical protein
VKALLRQTLAVLALLASSAAPAEQFVDRGEYRIHYNALNTTALTPEVARRFGITRTRNEALLVLSPQQRDEQGRYRPVPAQGEGRARSLLGHVVPLKLRPVRDGDSHYLVASFQILDGEFLKLELNVLPSGAGTPIPLAFQQQFYRE